MLVHFNKKNLCSRKKSECDSNQQMVKNQTLHYLTVNAVGIERYK